LVGSVFLTPKEILDKCDEVRFECQLFENWRKVQQQPQQSQQQYDIENGNGNSSNRKGSDVLSPVVSLDGNELTTPHIATSPTDTSEPSGSRRSMNYNNLFTLPYDEDEDSEYTRTPGGGEQQQRGSMGGSQQQQHPLLHRQNSSLATMPEHYWLSQSSLPHPGVAPNGITNCSYQHRSAMIPSTATTTAATNNRNRITNNLMINATSFSSDSDNDDSSHHHESINELDGSHDELDNYKNVNLEVFRTTIEQTVDVDGMVSLAMTRALTVPDLDNVAIPWAEYIGVVGGAKEVDKDGGNIIEACCLCETYDWLKRHENSSLDSM